MPKTRADIGEDILVGVNFRVDPPDPNIIHHELFGYDGVVAVKLNRRPVTIIEKGQTPTDAAVIAQLIEDEADPTKTVAVDTYGRGVFVCYLRLVEFPDWVSHGDGDKAVDVEYIRHWQQLVCGVDLGGSGSP